MQSSSAPSPTTSSSWAEACPWYWSGWQEAFISAGYTIEISPRLSVTGPTTGRFYFLTAAEVAVALKNATKDLETHKLSGKTVESWNKSHWDFLDPLLSNADGLFVDFFPDEIYNWSWSDLRRHASKMVFLPPLVKLPPAVAKPRKKQVFIVDTARRGILPPSPEPISKGAAGFSYQPLPANPSCFDASFDFVSIEGLKNISDILNAPGWVFQCTSPQIEQALYSVAQLYGIKVSFWERAYSSPLRYFSGYENPFDESYDKNLRARWKRVSSSSTQPGVAINTFGLDKVLVDLSFSKLGLAEIPTYFSFTDRLLLDRNILPVNFVSHLRYSHSLSSLALCAQKLKTSSGSHLRDALNSRVWKVLLGGIFCSAEPEARRSWYYLLSRHPEETLNNTLAILDSSFDLKLTTIPVIRLLLQTVVYYRIKGPEVQAFLNYLKQNERRWLTLESGPWGVEVKELIELLEGSSEVSLPAEHRESKSIIDLWITHGVLLLRAGKAEDGMCAIRYELERGTMSDFGWRIALAALFDHGGSFFHEFLARCVPHHKADAAAGACNEFNSSWIRNEAWRKTHLQGISSLVKLMQSVPTSYRHGGMMELCFKIILGEGSAAVAGYRTDRKIYNEETGIYLSLVSFLMGDIKSAQEALEAIGDAPLPPYFTAFKAVLNYCLGNTDKGREFMTQLKKSNEYFWQSSAISVPQAMLMFLLGVLGKATGDSELTSAALARLDVPIWENYRVGIQEVSRVSRAEPLEEPLRQWILKNI